MTSQQKLIVIAGAAGAYLILRSRSASASGARGGLLSNLLPTRGTNTPYVASTNMATRGGSPVARVPSSGLGYGTTVRGVAQSPSTVGGIAQGAGSALSSLFNYLARRPTSPVSSQQPRQTSQGGGGSSAGAGSAGSGASGGRAMVPMGGAANLAGQTYSNGYFDDNGNWIGYDGYYDEEGNWIPTTSSGLLESGGGGGGLQAIVPDVGPQNADLIAQATGSGAVDENGQWDPTLDPAVELIDAEPETLPSTDIGSGDFDFFSSGPVDPATSDFSGIEGGSTDDGSLVATDATFTDFGTVLDTVPLMDFGGDTGSSDDYPEE